MYANPPTLSRFYQHLLTRDSPFMLRRNGAPPQWSDAMLHQSAYQQYPELYALFSLADAVQPWQRVRILFQLLQASRCGIAPEVRRTLSRVTDFLLKSLPADHILTVFLALRRVRANHKHTTRAILAYIFNHPQLLSMANCRRRALVDSLEHALGKNTARGCAKMLSTPEIADSAYLHRSLLRFAQNPELVKQIVPQLYKKGSPHLGNSEYQLVHTPYPEPKERPTTVTATNRGDISATLVHLYRGGTSTALQPALEGYVTDAANSLPQFKGKLAIILDASASTQGYGSREYCCISQSVALKLVLEQCCSNRQIYAVGGSGSIPQPNGNTDLASALVDALENQPDVVAIISDGYENHYSGDLARVAATLPQLGIETPVVFCHSKFTNKDDLSWRQPTPVLPQLEFWHQDDFESLLMSLFSQANPSLSEPCLREFLLKKLARVRRIKQ